MMLENLKYFKTTIKCPSCRRKLAERGYYKSNEGEEMLMIEVRHKGFTALSCGMIIKCPSCNNTYYLTPNDKNPLLLNIKRKTSDGSDEEL